MYDISPEELKDYSAYTIVDIRDDMSYAYGHLPDAISVPQAELSTYIDEWKDTGKVLIYCKRGEASADAVLMLRDRVSIRIIKLAPRLRLRAPHNGCCFQPASGMRAGSAGRSTPT